MNRFLKLTLITLTFSNLFVLAGCTKSCGEKPTALQPAANCPCQQSQYLLEQKWGIKFESAQLSAGGYMIDFRYRVIDPSKAAPLLDRKIKPYLVDQTTGAKFIVPNPPKVGSLRSASRNIKKDNICFIIFANPARYVKSGKEVTVVIGDCEIKDVVVQ